jgi:hypothetical protein
MCESRWYLFPRACAHAHAYRSDTGFHTYAAEDERQMTDPRNDFTALGARAGPGRDRTT